MTKVLTGHTILLARDGVALCNCGCETPRNKGDFLPGHDSKLKSLVAQAHADGTSIVLVLANGDTKTMTAMAYAEMRNWGHKVETMAENIKRKADKATVRAASKTVGQLAASNHGVTLATLKAAAEVCKATGRYGRNIAGDRYLEVTHDNAAAIAAGTHPDIADDIERHRSGWFVGQTVQAPEAAHRVAVVRAIKNGKATLQTQQVGGGGPVTVIPVTEIQPVSNRSLEIPTGPAEMDEAV